VPVARHEAPKIRLAAPRLGRERLALHKEGLASGTWPPTHWWRSFHDPVLRRLIRVGLQNNNSIQIAEFHVRAARASYRLAQSQTELSLDAQGRLARERASATGLVPPPFAGHTLSYGSAGLGAQYDLASWGRRHWAIQTAVGALRATFAQNAEIRLLVSTEIAERYWEMAAAACRLQQARAVLAVHKRLRALLGARMKAGIQGAIRYDQEAADTALARAAVQEARLDLRSTQLSLAALVGRGPRFGLRLTAPSVRHVPTPLFPDHIRLDLIARRPDIQVRYWQVREAYAGRMTARARYYPDISLDARLAYQSITPADLLDPANLAARFGPAIHLPLFDSGARHAQLKVSRSRFDIAVARYNEAIVNAAAQVAGALEAVATARQNFVQAQRARHLSEQAFMLTQARLKAGILGRVSARRAQIPVLVARYRQQRARIAIDEASIRVLKSLGGGYHAPKP